MNYTIEEKEYIISKIPDILWTRIPISLKLFWKKEYKKSIITTTTTTTTV